MLVRLTYKNNGFLGGNQVVISSFFLGFLRLESRVVLWGQIKTNFWGSSWYKSFIMQSKRLCRGAILCLYCCKGLENGFSVVLLLWRIAEKMTSVGLDLMLEKKEYDRSESKNMVTGGRWFCWWSKDGNGAATSFFFFFFLTTVRKERL